MTEGSRFTAPLWRSQTVDAWHFVTLPPDAAALVGERPRPQRGFGSVRVQVRVGSTIWRTSVFPDRASASYLLPVKRSVRLAEDLEEGEPVTISLEVLE
ncbi:DUF1905 domain-containing protein [Ornithinimicrobium tianjinense]|uniref:DUF1905 domain-containing protein n=1 Tax=Ornithinimicrobium tianjinense TaxID=1195761 RepID=A0A917F370_9MICO|nr:DUF1905 domain-containing protein [Ornithinimicrobium tianjinense]GGF44277.1 hypothetical protein GCM10011366_09970 [Ornithinimicrobium tianjinense]